MASGRPALRHGDSWATKKEGAQRAGAVTDAQKAAIKQARNQAIREKVEVGIHGKDGSIRDSDDPNSPKAKKH